MGKEPFESFFQEGLKNHEVELDTQSIWEGIEPSLPPASSGMAWPWWSIAGLLIVAGTVWAVIQGPEQGESTITQIATYNNIEDGSSPSTQAMATIGGQEEKEDDNHAGTDEVLETEMGIVGGATEESLIGEASSSSNLVENKVIVDDESDMVGRTTERTPMDGSTGRISSFVVGSGRVDEENNDDVFEEKSIGFNTAASDAGRAGRGLNGAMTSTLTSEAMATENVGQLTEEVANLRVKYADLESIRPLDEVSQLTWSRAVPAILPPKGLDCYDFRSWSLAWSVDAYTGFHYAGKSLSDNNGGEVNDYIQARENTESYLEAFDAGLTVNVMHRKGYLASVGVNYSQINEKFNFFTVTSTTRFDSVPIRINIDSAGMADTIKAWRPITVQSTEERLTYNSYRMVDIPIALGYHFFNGKWSYEVRAGVMFNLLFQQKGEILNDQLIATNIESGDIFRSQVGLSVFGGVKILYPVNKRFSAFVEPVGRFNLKPVTVDSYALSQRYNQFGVRLGARLHL